MHSIKVGNGAGFWGDNLDAPRRLAESGGLDYLTLEYLAELTLSILAHQRSRDPDAGFVADFPIVLRSLAPLLVAQPDLKIVTNAGGMNPMACARASAAILADAGMEEIQIASVSGDDLLPRLDEFIESGESFTNLDTAQPLGVLRSQLASANAYLGSAGIVEALSQEARIVITGRVADASLTVGPAVHEFGWKWDDWNLLAAASVAGHLIECGAQVTGGMFSGWTPRLTFENLGYPIAEISADGSIVITKPAGTGGTVTTASVAEQLVYEIGDPAHYLTPDVDVDFSHVELRQVADNRVAVSRAAGNPAPARFKVSMAYRDGYMGAGTLVIYGKDAVAKARMCGDLVLSRVRAAGIELERTNIECLGTGDAACGVWAAPQDSIEVVLRVSVRDRSKESVERFLREFSPLAGSGPPGVTGYTGPRPKPHPVFAYWPTTISRERVTPAIHVRTATAWRALSPCAGKEESTHS